MLLFQKRFHEGLVRGDVRLTFRRWDKPHVRTSGRYRCHPIGVLEVDAVARVKVAAITDADAALAGFESRTELLAYMASVPGPELGEATEVFRIELHHGGDGDRVEIALDDELDDAEIARIAERLAKMDAKEPWTKKTLALIGKHPRVAASQLALKVGRDTASFKVDVRRLKKLGLTQSFEVGYEISPRGRAFLERAKKKTTKRRPG
jgi:hypothetical protein